MAAQTGTGPLTNEQLKFLDENAFVGIITTVRRDGSPHSTVVWVDEDDGLPSFNTARGRAKERYLKRDPRAALLVVDPENPYRWVSITGQAELIDEGANEQIDKLAKKYLGEDEYPWRNPAEQRVKVRIAPEKVDSSGFDE
jgi:PPOX class probable F420-dependent enzyme